MKLYEKQDDQGTGMRRAGTNKYFRAKKHRVERRRANQNPECAPYYTRNRGWAL